MAVDEIYFRVEVVCNFILYNTNTSTSTYFYILLLLHLHKRLEVKISIQPKRERLDASIKIRFGLHRDSSTGDSAMLSPPANKVS